MAFVLLAVSRRCRPPLHAARRRPLAPRAAGPLPCVPRAAAAAAASGPSLSAPPQQLARRVAGLQRGRALLAPAAARRPTRLLRRVLARPLAPAARLAAGPSSLVGEMPLRREGIYFYIVSLLRGKFPIVFGSSVGRLFGDAQCRFTMQNGYAWRVGSSVEVSLRPWVASALLAAAWGQQPSAIRIAVEWCWKRGQSVVLCKAVLVCGMQGMAAMASSKIIRLNFSEFEHWKHEKFSRFVNNLLLLRAKGDLHTFQLHCESDCWRLLNCNNLRTWIGYAVRQNVKVLDVKLYQYDKTVLPRCIFNNRSLQDLKLDMGKAPHKDYEHEELVLPDIIDLPSLKKLFLRDVEVHDSSLKEFIAQSPGLEDVHLINCAHHLELIDSKVLKRLTIDGCIDGDKGLTIAAPNLIHFECIGWPLDDISWREQPSLESAHIDTCGCGDTFDSQSDFTGAFLHAKRLALFGSDIKLSPRLENLTLKHRKSQLQCSKDDDQNEIDKIVNAMVANGSSLEKIHVTYYEDIRKRELAERRLAGQEEKVRGKLEKILKRSREWVDDFNDYETEEDEDEEMDEDDDEDDELF
ncbi:hypothetical protein EJB05_16703, partial [Eragrostis curvula]